MSLLNDALRKKDREKQSQGKIAGRPFANSVPRHKRRRLYWLTGIGSVLFLAIGVGIGLVVHSIEAPSVLALESAPDISTRHGVAEDTPPLAVKPASGAAAKSVSLATEIRAGELKTTPDAPKDKMLDTEDIRPEVVHPPVLSEEAASPEPNPQPNNHEVSAGSHVDGSGQIASVSAAVQTTKNDREALRPSEQVSQAARYYRKALSYHRQGRVHRAIALYRQVVQLQPHHFDARFNLVSAYIHTREFTKAHRIAVELYHQDGTNQQVLSNLAIAKIGMGQSREALQLLDQVVDFPQTSMFTVYLHKGIAYRSLNQMDAAIGWYKKAEELKPDDPQLLFNLALAYDRQQQYGEAAHYYQAYLPQAEIDESISEKDIRRRIHTLRSYLAQEAAQEQNVK
jgi:Flp pilus assembly protein TadD